MTQHEVITQIRDAITTGDYGLAVRALNEYGLDYFRGGYKYLRDDCGKPPKVAYDEASELTMQAGFSVFQKSLNKQ